MRILVVAEQYPWPAVDGYRQRLDHMIRGLARAGDVEVITLDRRPVLDDDPAPEVVPDGVVEVTAVPAGVDAGPREWATTWVGGATPRRLLQPDWTPLIDACRARLTSTTAPTIDLVWCSHVDTWWPLRDVLAEARMAGSRVIVDFDNLEHLALRLRRRTPARVAPDAPRAERWAERGRWLTSRAFDLVDERRWDRLQRECASEVDHVVVCSGLDVERSRCPNAVVVGNGASAPASVREDRRRLAGADPTMLFVGALDYEPNTEAVEWFVREVLPLVRQHEPSAALRVVGRGADRVAWVREVPGVQLVGAVADLRPELEAADVSVVPIRVGAGTRLKVVEALANRLPMVSTTVGCEGIDLTDGVDALLADDPRSFADRCLRLLGDGELRQSIADAGAELFARRYDWAAIEDGLAELARRTADAPA